MGAGDTIESDRIRYVKGAPKSKLIVGIPFYGQSFSTKGGATSYGAEPSGPGEAGRWTKQRGMLAFYEICTKGFRKLNIQ